MTLHPRTEADTRYSTSDDPTPWPDALAELERAELCWVTTVRADGRPHVTPLLTVWRDDALHFCTGEGEQKQRNLAANPHVLVLTGTNREAAGTDVVVEGVAEPVHGAERLQQLADAWVERFGERWRFDAADDGFRHEGAGPDSQRVPVFAVRPVTAYAHAKGPDTYVMTRYTF